MYNRDKISHLLTEFKMPFTVSHAVLAVPLAKLCRDRIPTAAIAIGCMTPDLARLFTRHEVVISHQWSGLIVPNLILGIFFCFLWYALYRPTLYAWLNIDDTLNIKSINLFCSFILVCLMGILIGSATHIVWDGFTHLDYRTIAFHQALAQNIPLFGYSFALHEILQIVCSILAMPIIFWMMARYYAQHQDTEHAQHFSLAFYLSFIASTAVAVYQTIAYLSHYKQYHLVQHPYFFLGESLNTFASWFLICFTLCCVISLLYQYVHGRFQDA